MNQNVPENFNWILARAECSPTTAFVRLRAQIQEDVQQRIALMTDRETANCHFRVEMGEWQFFVAVRSFPDFERGILFARSSYGVSVSDLSTGKMLHEGYLTLANDGECKLKVGEVEYSFWQFRKLTLDDLLFTSVAKWRS